MDDVRRGGFTGDARVSRTASLSDLALRRVTNSILRADFRAVGRSSAPSHVSSVISAFFFLFANRLKIINLRNANNDDLILEYNLVRRSCNKCCYSLRILIPVLFCSCATTDQFVDPSNTRAVVARLQFLNGLLRVNNNCLTQK